MRSEVFYDKRRDVFLERDLEEIGAIGGYRKKLEGLKGGAASKKNTPSWYVKNILMGIKKYPVGILKFRGRVKKLYSHKHHILSIE